MAKRVIVLQEFTDKDDLITVYKPGKKLVVDDDRAADLVARGLADLQLTKAEQAALDAQSKVAAEEAHTQTDKINNDEQQTTAARIEEQ